MTADIDRQYQQHHQLEAARELVAILQLGMVLDLPPMHWDLARTSCVLTGTPGADRDPGVRESVLRRWADALEAVTDGATAVVSVRRGRGGIVQVVLTPND